MLIPLVRTSVALPVVSSRVALTSVLLAGLMGVTTRVRSCIVAVGTVVRQRTSMA